MRLLSAETLRLETFPDDASAPPFAILSHTWGPDEPTLQDLQLPARTLARRQGWRKVTRFRDAVAAHPRLLSAPVRHLWVDTVCIDKTSSAELSEAINSMFRWYRDAACCFAVLGDVEGDGEGDVGEDFEASRWFTRGWTLQELLAPRDVHFFDGEWTWIGSKASLASRIAARTGIAKDIVLTGEWPFATVAQRMSWMSGRVTTRVEDIAYCLLGIFDVNMPMLYGEGERAFVRLQEEIIRDSDDESIFAWDASDVPASVKTVGVLASHPRQFREAAQLECLPSEAAAFSLTNKGLHITLPIIERQEEPGKKIALLSCLDAKDASSLIGIRVRQDRLSQKSYSRLPGPPIVVPVRDEAVWRAAAQDIYLARREQGVGADKRLLKCKLEGAGPLAGLRVVSLSPRASWYVNKAQTMTMAVPRVDVSDAAGVTSALLFSLIGTEHAFFLVLNIQPLTRIAKVGLVACEKVPEGETLGTMLGRLRTSAGSIATGERAEVGFGDERIFVRADAGGSSVLKVKLSRVLTVSKALEGGGVRVGDGASQSESVRGGSVRGGTAKGVAAKDAPKAGSAKGVSSKGETEKGGTAKDAQKNGSARGGSQKDASAKGASQRDGTTKDPSKRNSR